MEDFTNRDGLTREETEAFVGKNHFFYLDKWESRPNSTLKGWNWSAALFGIEWMAYRKMYVEAFLYFLVIFAMSIILALVSFYLNIDIIGKLIGDTFRILIGVFGNALYYKKAIRAKNKMRDMDESKRLIFISSKGGVSYIGLGVCILFEIIYSVVLYFL